MVAATHVERQGSRGRKPFEFLSDDHTAAAAALALFQREPNYDSRKTRLLRPPFAMKASITLDIFVSIWQYFKKKRRYLCNNMKNKHKTLHSALIFILSSKRITKTEFFL